MLAVEDRMARKSLEVSRVIELDSSNQSVIKEVECR